MKLHYGIALCLIFLAACDANAPASVNQRCVQVNAASMARFAAELEDDARSGIPTSDVSRLRSPEFRGEIERQCDCFQRALTGEDYRFLIGGLELRESLAAEDLPQDVIIYRIREYAAEHTGGDGDEGEARIDRLFTLAGDACPLSTPP